MCLIYADALKKQVEDLHNDSIFANLYGTYRWCNALWRESERVLVSILSQDGSHTVDKGKLNDGE